MSLLHFDLMKSCSIIFCFLFSLSLSAQIKEPNALKAGFGISRFIEEKINTPTLLVAFNKDFYPNTFVEISAEWAMPVDVSTEDELRELSSYRFGMNLFYKVLDEPNQAFNAGVGFSAGFYGLDYTILASDEQDYTIEFNPKLSNG